MTMNYWIKRRRERGGYWLSVLYYDKNGTLEGFYKFYNDFTSLAKVLDRYCSKANMIGGYVKFSDRTGDYPTDKYEIMFTVIQNNQILLPVSDGGTWQEWDDHLNT